MGNVFGWIGELGSAEPWYRESLRIAREIDDQWSILDNLNCLADSYLGLGQIPKAKELFAAGLRLAVDLGARGYLAWFVHGLCEVARQEGRLTRAARLRAFETSLESGWQDQAASSLEKQVAYALEEE